MGNVFVYGKRFSWIIFNLISFQSVKNKFLYFLFNNNWNYFYKASIKFVKKHCITRLFKNRF